MPLFWILIFRKHIKKELFLFSFRGQKDQEMKRKREQRYPRRSHRGWTAWAEIDEKGEETVVPVIHMISTWKLNLYLTFKVMFMFIF